MAGRIQMYCPETGEDSFAYRGFSWTTLFFGPFPALFRGHFSAFFVMLLGEVVTLGLFRLVFIFLYNKWHYDWLVDHGFRSALSVAYHGTPGNLNVIPSVNVLIQGAGSPNDAAKSVDQPINRLN